MNYEKFLNVVIIMVPEIIITNYIFNMLKHKVKELHLVEDLQLSGILKYHN